MAVPGKIISSLFHGSQELSVALASLNFDFSLVKLEAPKAYHGLGTALSTQRKKVAEEGLAHVTARKLGAIFEEMLPNTPKLLEAYGRRASEIAMADNTAEVKQSAGFFSGYTGLDGTSIWAAATSGSAAVSVHLLACMLAKMFPAPEAVSIWVELVEARKKQIALLTEQNDNATKFSLFLAGQCLITREQLAEWDNSARAWLRRAEQVKKKQQTQLILICSNINLPVNATPNTFGNVIEGWRTALTGMENLLNGQSQQVHDGGLLLALSSWHLYPDIVAHGDILVKQSDDMFAAGTQVVLGLEASPSQDAQGVYWCLPLAHLRFYGDPEVSTQAVRFDTSRLSPLQLSCVALGSMLSSWESEGRDVMKVSRILTGLYSLVYGDWKNESEDHPSCQWLLTLVKAASALLSAQDAERELLLKLVALGRSKKAQSFLGRSSRRPPPVFGLTNYDLLVSTLSNLEDCVNVLRHAALRCFKSQLSSQVIIRYYTSHGIPEYCTGLPHDEQSESTRSYNRALKALPLRPWRHLKWITDEFESPAKHSKLPAVMETVERIFKANSGMRSIPPGSLVWDFEDGNPFSSDLGLGKLHDEPESSQWKGAKRKQEFDTCTPGPVMRSMKKNKYEAASADVEIEDPTPSSVKIVEPEEVNVDDAESTKSRKETYKLFVGASSRAGLFVHEDLLKMYTSDNPFIGVLPQYAPLDVLEKALELDLLDAGRMRFALEAAVNKAPTHGHEDFAVSLAALGLATSAYANLGEASISPRVVAKPLCSAKWLGRGHGSAYKTLTELGSKTCMTREETFSCIAYLDYGLDIELQAFKNVMAISCGDSIYVASALLRDPLDQEDSRPVRRIIGNVGKPGLALLVPPANPRCLEVRAEDWKLINCEAYKGKPADNFGGTSLSLSFTNWRIPVELRDAERGRQDIEAYTYETLISVFEKGKWIADLDVLDALSKGHFIRGREWFYKVGCKHVEDTSSTPGVFIPASVDDGVNIDLGSRESQAEFVNSHLQDLAAPNTPEEVADIDPEMGEPLDEVVTINSWEEFLDHPSGPAIVMAHKNWPARLAAAALAVRRHDRVFVAEEFCWQCLTEIKGYGEDKFVKNSVFIC